MSLISFKHIRKSFGTNVVLQDLSLDIQEGETFTIIGGSGTGKSLTLKILLALEDPDSGQVIYKGKNVFEMTDEELLKMRTDVGMVFQGSALFDSLTVFENVAYPIREHMDYTENKISDAVKEKLKLVGLDGIQDRYPQDLSGGMRKRVGLARALAMEPEVILYDEPTAGLDPANTNRIDELILTMQKVLGVTSIVVTHHMESAFKISNRMALLHNKKIEFVGSVDEIKNSKNPVVQNFIHGVEKPVVAF